MNRFYDFVKKIEEASSLYSFEERKIENTFNFKNIVILRRRNWLSNNAIALIELSDNQMNNISNLGKFSQEIKIRLGKQIGYTFFVDALALKIIFFGRDIIRLSDNLSDYVDKINNQRVILQSIHIVDNYNKKNKSVRTWGQAYSGRYHDLIEKTIKEFERMG